MKTLAMATIVLACFALVAPADAQNKTRAEVKAEAASAVKAGEIPKGEAAEPKAQPTRKFSTNEKAAARSTRKSETAAALKAGEVPKGDIDLQKPEVKPRATAGDKAAARAKRKAETADAVKSGEIPKGEAALPGK